MMTASKVAALALAAFVLGGVMASPGALHEACSVATEDYGTSHQGDDALSMMQVRSPLDGNARDILRSASSGTTTAAGFVMTARSNGPTGEFYTMLLSPEQHPPSSSSTLGFVATQLQDGGYKDSYAGKVENFTFNKGTKEFSGAVVFGELGWTGRISGTDWQGTIDMTDGHSYTIQVRPLANSDKTMGGDIVDPGVGYISHCTSGGNRTAAFTFLISKKQGSSYDFVALGFAGSTQQHWIGKLEDFQFNTSTKEYHARVLFTNMPWTGKLIGRHWLGEITMQNGYTYQLGTAPLSEGALTSSLSEGLARSAAYFAYVQGGPTGTMHGMTISRKHGSTYSFVAHNFAQTVFAGQMRNFEFDAGTGAFSADFVADGLPWKGKVAGKDWKGEITMEDKGFNYTIHILPVKGAQLIRGSAPLELAKPQGMVSSTGYLGLCKTRRGYDEDFSLVVSHKSQKQSSTTYSIVGSGFSPNGVAQMFPGFFRNFLFDKATESFSADVEFLRAYRNQPWIGKLTGRNWTGSIDMASGYSYAVSFQPM